MARKKVSEQIIEVAEDATPIISEEEKQMLEEINVDVEQSLSDSKAYQSMTGATEFKPIAREKTLGNTDQNKCRDNVKDVVIFGDDLFKLMSKASSVSEGWMKSTKAMDTGKGCVVQVTTQQRNQDGNYSLAEAVTYVPGVKIIERVDRGNNVIGRYLKSTH